MNIKDRLAQALLSSQAVPPPQQDPGQMAQTPVPQNPFLPNPALEQTAQAQGVASPLHPLVAAIMNHLGLLNMVRNHNNQAGVDPESPAQ